MPSLPYVYASTDNHVTTTSTAFQDALTITADKFEADHIYICHVVADIGGSSRSGNVRIRVTHGGTLITGSEGRREPDSPSVTRFHHYRFLCKHSPGGSPDDVVVDYCRASSSMSASIANIQALFLDVTDLDEDTDYYYNENTTTDLLSTTLSDHANLNIAAANGDEWLVIGSAQVDIAATSVGYNVLLSCDDLTGDDADLPHYRVEAEDSGDFDCCGLERVYELDEGSHNVAVKMSAVHSSNPASHDHSAIFAINLKLFESYTLSSQTLFSPDPNGVIPGDDGDAAFTDSEDIAALPAWKPDTTSSAWIIGGFTISDADRDRVHYRLRYNETAADTLPPNATSNSYGHESYFSGSSDPVSQRDRLSCYRSVILEDVSSLADSEEVYKFEADSAQGSNTENDYFDSHLYVISLELAETGGGESQTVATSAAPIAVSASASPTVSATVSVSTSAAPIAVSASASPTVSATVSVATSAAAIAVSASASPTVSATVSVATSAAPIVVSAASPTVGDGAQSVSTSAAPIAVSASASPTVSATVSVATSAAPIVVSASASPTVSASVSVATSAAPIAVSASASPTVSASVSVATSAAPIVVTAGAVFIPAGGLGGMIALDVVSMRLVVTDEAFILVEIDAVSAALVIADSIIL